MSEWFRRNAGVVVFNAEHKVLVCERIDISNAWQFPQGGIEEGETPCQAAVRELREETSLQNVKLVKTLSTPVCYYFPAHVLSKMQKHGYTNSGQEMYWSLFYFDGDNAEINLMTDMPEFKAFKWVNIEQAYEMCVEFKKIAYKVAVTEFAEIIAAYPQISCA